MDTKLKKDWIEALRSGDYEQGQGQLRIFDESVDKFCCLGVLCNISGMGEWEGNTFYSDDYESDEHFTNKYYCDTSVPVIVREVVNITEEECNTLASMNDGNPDLDGTGKSFDEIADYIEEHL